MSIARHHAEWLSLVEVSGPFVSLPVLLRAFPQGLNTDRDGLRPLLRVAYDEWREGHAEPALHRAWLRWVLREVLELTDDLLLAGPELPPELTLELPEYGETLRPDLVVAEPGARPRILVQLLPAGRSLEAPLPGGSPATRMMALLRAAGVRLGLLTNGERWMLVDAPAGETTGFSSWYAELWLDEPLTFRAFHSLLGAHRLFTVPDDQTLEALLAASASDQQDVTDQLGYQVRRAVELLVQALDLADQDRGRALLAGIAEQQIYEAALTVMMRLVFLFSAEERGLLLLGEQLYDQHYAVSTLRAQLREAADQQTEEVLERRFDAWARLLATFRAVYAGARHDRLALPAYGGSLFSPDRFPFLEGRPAGSSWRATPADPLPINNRTVLHLLEALQMLQVRVPGGGPAEARRLSFRALDIEQIGHVYEGLLDHTAVRAAEPVLGLAGTKDREPELPLSQLERLGEPALLKLLSEETGRSLPALKKDLARPADLLSGGPLLAACGNDQALFERVAPFAGLLRLDPYGLPTVVPAGSIYVTAGAERRSTGTHYTPRSLTEPIVQHTLEPLAYRGPAEGLPRAEWQLRSPEELLALKVCDLAMGSGAFLVQACRYLAERLVEAWARRDPWGAALPADPELRLSEARRLVADRCLYGVDKNPLAAEMAKLSLWLITLAKDRPFTFLDHALKAGDSLLGVDVAQLKHWSLDRASIQQYPLISAQIDKALDRALRLRRQIEQIEERDIRDTELKAELLAQADAILDVARLGGDLLIAATLADAPLRATLLGDWQTRYSLLLTALEDVQTWVPGNAPIPQPTALADQLRRESRAALGRHTPFHWPLEFPEVFTDRGGFDAFVGNPPFMGGKKITGALGTPYRDYLVDYLAGGTKGSADICAYFFLRAGDMLDTNGQFGLIATNTIAQGDTREVGLDQLAARGFTIPRAVPSRPWPGVAAVEVAHVYARNGSWLGLFALDEQPVTAISSFLTVPSRASGPPKSLSAHSGKASQGSVVLGLGFVLTPEEAEALMERDTRNQEVLFPYLSGEDLNSRPDQSPPRWIINFHDWPLERAETYPDVMRIVREKVKPMRAESKRATYRDRWWQYAEKQTALYKSISGLKRVLLLAQVSRTVGFVFVPNTSVYSHKTIIFGFQDAYAFAILQSSFHIEWAWNYTATMKSDLSYSPSDVFVTFPFPEHLDGLEEIGERYHEHRRQLMLARQEGLTKTYNRLHDPAEHSADIQQLRELHIQMDQAVASAYGWGDLDLGHGFHATKQGTRHTIAEPARREILDRLLELNHQRHAAEVAAGLHDKPTKPAAKKGRKKASAEGQGTLF